MSKLNKYKTFKLVEGAIWRCSVKKVFLKISQTSLENACGRVSFLVKLPARQRL